VLLRIARMKQFAANLAAAFPPYTKPPQDAGKKKETRKVDCQPANPALSPVPQCTKETDKSLSISPGPPCVKEADKSLSISPAPQCIKEPDKSLSVSPAARCVKGPDKSLSVSSAPQCIKEPDKSLSISPAPQCIKEPVKSLSVSPAPQCIKGPDKSLSISSAPQCTKEPDKSLSVSPASQRTKKTETAIQCGTEKRTTSCPPVATRRRDYSKVANEKAATACPRVAVFMQETLDKCNERLVRLAAIAKEKGIELKTPAEAPADPGQRSKSVDVEMLWYLEAKHSRFGANNGAGATSAMDEFCALEDFFMHWQEQRRSGKGSVSTESGSLAFLYTSYTGLKARLEERLSVMKIHSQYVGKKANAL
jgi:hypothetical protein